MMLNLHPSTHSMNNQFQTGTSSYPHLQAMQYSNVASGFSYPTENYSPTFTESRSRPSVLGKRRGNETSTDVPKKSRKNNASDKLPWDAHLRALVGNAAQEEEVTNMTKWKKTNQTNSQQTSKIQEQIASTQYAADRANENIANAHQVGEKLYNEAIIDNVKIPLVFRETDHDGKTTKECLLLFKIIDEALLLKYNAILPEYLRLRLPKRMISSVSECAALHQSECCELVEYNSFMQFYELVQKFVQRSKKSTASAKSTPSDNSLEPIASSSSANNINTEIRQDAKNNTTAHTGFQTVSQTSSSSTTRNQANKSVSAQQKRVTTKKTPACGPSGGTAWIQVNESMIPVIYSDGKPFAPKIVVDYATDAVCSVSHCICCTLSEGRTLTQMCAKQGIQMEFPKNSLLVDINAVNHLFKHFQFLPKDNPQKFTTIPESQNTTVHPVPVEMHTKEFKEKTLSCVRRNLVEYVLLEGAVRVFFSFHSMAIVESVITETLCRPLDVCTREEEQAFIRFYGLQLQQLPNKKIVPFDAFTACFQRIQNLVALKDNEHTICTVSTDDVIVLD